MAAKKTGLGRGLDALFPEKSADDKPKQAKADKEKNTAKAAETAADSSKSAEMMVKISKVEPNLNQPRKQFDEDSLSELAESIKQYGILQPLLVSDKKDYYEIIAGERRWRAAKMAGLKEVPVLVREFLNRRL